MKFSLKALFLLIVILILTPGFYRNQWLAAGKARFYELRTHTEHMVLARLVESRHSGVFSYGALLGFGIFETGDFDPVRVTQAYKDNTYFVSYSPYTSNPGLEGIFLSFFEQSTGFSSSTDLRIFHAIEALLTSLLLGLFVYWTVHEFGWFAGVLTFIFMAMSEWLTLFGGNVYWNLWAFYLPLVVTSFYLKKTSTTGNYSQAVFGIILAFVMLIKCLFTGFEYITTALLMPLMPFIFYAIRDTWGWAKFIARSLYASIGLSIGVVAGLFTLAWQIAQVKTGFQEAVITIFDAFGKRSIGNPAQYAPEAESLKASLASVLTTYINGRAINLSQILYIKEYSSEISYLALFVTFFVFTILVLVQTKTMTTDRKNTYAIIATTWVSIVAPLSWLILFKAHSFIHTMLNFMVWQMPFTLYGFALSGYALGQIFSFTSTRKSLKNR